MSHQGIATGEVFAFPEGRLYLYASGSGNTSGSGIGFAVGAQMQYVYGWKERFDAGAIQPKRAITGQRCDLTIDNLLGDLVLFNLANATSMVQAKFEGLITGGRVRSAEWILNSGAVDSVGMSQDEGNTFRGSYAAHFYSWSAFGEA